MMRPRTCPTHRVPMQRLIATSANGKELELDRCGECGSLWFDAGELEQLATHRALDAGPGFEHFCPSCSDPARDPSVGGSFAAARCNACHGTYLDAATVAGLEGLPRLPDAEWAGQVGFVCAECEGRFPYVQGNLTARGLVCGGCVKDAVRVPRPAELGGLFAAVFKFLS